MSQFAVRLLITLLFQSAILIVLGILQVERTYYVLIACILLTFVIHAIYRRAKNVALIITIALGSLTLSIALAEVILRVLFPLSTVFNEPSKVLMAFSSSHSTLYSYTPNKTMTMSSLGDLAGMSKNNNIAVEKRPILFSTDQHGLRNAENEIQESPILLLGDSFGVGLGTTQDRTLATMLQKLSGQKVYNLSFPGSPASQLRRLESMSNLAKNAKTLIWLFFAGNDLYEPYDHLYRSVAPLSSLASTASTFRTWQAKARIPLFVESITSANIRDDLVLAFTPSQSIGPMLFHKDWSEQARMSKTQIEKHPNMTLFRETLSRMHALNKTMNLQIILVSIPAKATIYHARFQRWQYPEVLEELTQEFSMHYLDLTPQLRKRAKELERLGETLWWPDDTHWNEEGHRLAAEVLTEIVSQTTPSNTN